MKLAALALATTLGLGVGVAQANHDDPARPRGQFRQLVLERFDRNHDGRLEPQERRRAIRALKRLTVRMAMQERRAEIRDARWSRDPHERRDRALRRFDTNHDGVIDPQERRDARDRALRRFDTNRDGVVSPDEMPRGAARTLRPLDENRDGWVDQRDQK